MSSDLGASARYHRQVPQKPDTNAITAGRDGSGSLSPSIWPNSVWESDSLQDATKRATGLRSETFYSRFANPTVTQFENAVAELEGALRLPAAPKVEPERGHAGPGR